MKFYLVRHGQSCFNKEGILGGNPELTPRGIQEANKVASILKEIKLSKIYCSKLKRAVQTATIIHSYHPKIPLIKASELNEINYGILDSITRLELKEKFPDLCQQRKEDKYNFRAPNGENFNDVLKRITPLMNKITSENKDICIVAHQTTNRVIISHFFNLDKEKIPYIKIPRDIPHIIDTTKKELYYIKNNKRCPGVFDYYKSF